MTWLSCSWFLVGYGRPVVNVARRAARSGHVADPLLTLEIIRQRTDLRPPAGRHP